MHCLQVCQQEHQLSRHFFAADDPEGSALGPLMEPLCTILYDALRPRFIQLQHLSDLCELVDILQHEVRGLVLKHGVHCSGKLSADSIFGHQPHDFLTGEQGGLGAHPGGV